MGRSTSRGAAYPSIGLKEAVAKLRQVYDKVGKGPSSKESYVQGLGYASISGASNRTFAALVHYGLLEKSGGDYRISSLGMKIIFPSPDETETEQQLLRRAALASRLFRAIYDKYVGEKLPTLLANALIHDFQVYDKSAKEAAQNFQQSLEYAGLIDEERRVLGQDEGQMRSEHTAESPMNAGGASERVATTSPKTQLMEIGLENGEKAVLSAPFGVSLSDKDRLKKAIDLFV